MQPNCKGKCFAETKKRCNFYREYIDPILFKKNLPKTWKNCAECGYTILTDVIRCYCCNNPYRTRPHGNSRKETLEIILQRTGKRRY